MCVVCVLWEKGKLNMAETDKAFREIVSTTEELSFEQIEHIEQAMERIQKAEEA